MAELALLDWLTVPEAAARLKTSERTVERRIAAGEIETQPRSRPGKRPETVCHPRDVGKLMPQAHLVKADTGSALAPMAGLEMWGMLAGLAMRSSRGAGKGWLTLTEASKSSGLSVRFLRRLIRAGEIQAVKDRAWKIDRFSLDTWQPNGQRHSFDTVARLTAASGGQA